MKRITLTLLLLAPVALTGCQTIREHNPFRHKEPAYKSAQQEQPLEVPPGMNQPPTTEALTIPNAGSGNASEASSATQPPSTAAPEPEAEVTPTAASTTGNSMTLSDTPESAYHRVGLALERGDVGQVTAHDDTAHTYQIAVNTVVTQKPQGGFFHRMFHHAKSETVEGTVTIGIAPSGTGSIVSVQGTPDAVARVMTVLKQRLE